MSNVRVFMAADNSNSTTREAESSAVIVREYPDAHYSVSGDEYLHVIRVDDHIATFPPTRWVGVELY